MKNEEATEFDESCGVSSAAAGPSEYSSFNELTEFNVLMKRPNISMDHSNVPMNHSNVPMNNSNVTNTLTTTNDHNELSESHESGESNELDEANGLDCVVSNSISNIIRKSTKPIELSTNEHSELTESNESDQQDESNEFIIKSTEDQVHDPSSYFLLNEFESIIR